MGKPRTDSAARETEKRGKVLVWRRVSKEAARVERNGVVLASGERRVLWRGCEFSRKRRWR